MKQLGVLQLPSGRDASPSQVTQHEATRSITTPPGRDASPPQDTQHKATGSIFYNSPLEGMLVHCRVTPPPLNVC